MRTSNALRMVVMMGGLGLCSASAFDGPQAPSAAAPRPPMTAMEAFRSGTAALQAGENSKAVTSLQYAAEHGHFPSQWKLGRMYARGEGVQQDDLKAFRYFSGIVNSHAEDNPSTPQARFVASAFVSLGRYYLEGIANSEIRRDVNRARDMFRYAASYFGDPDAQYHLGRLYLESKDMRQAARWLRLAANKSQYEAQALLGSLLFNGGNQVPRQAAQGLMWLMLARDSAAAEDRWISETYNNAVKRASDEEREMALVYLHSFMKGRRE